MRNLLNFLAIVVILVSCDTSKKQDNSQQSNVHKVTAEEVIQVEGYTYIRVLEDGKEKWLAAPASAVEAGKELYYGSSMEMSNFESKELGRSFEKIYFVDRILDNPEGLDQPAPNPHMQSTPQISDSPKPVIEKNEVTVEALADGISIAELMENKKKYAGKVVKLKGKVTKYNPGIMNVNWFHVQDGSNFNGEFDLTATTKAEVKLNDIVTFQGTVTLDKDFGAGYFYAIIIENAELVK
jgi:hypothetical protein